MLDSRDEGETLRSLARLRKAVVLRSGLEPGTIEELTRALRAIWANAVEWGNRRRLARVASLEYSLTDESLTVDRHGRGWLARRAPAARRGRARGSGERRAVRRNC